MNQLTNTVLNFIGGIPDLPFAYAPDPSVPKNRKGREQYLAELSFYARGDWDQAKRPFFTVPDEAPPLQSVERLAFHDGEREVLTYPSRYQVRNPALKDEFESYERNLTGYLNFWRKDESERRPLVLCLHGFMMGQPARAEQMFQIKRLMAMGLDVALFSIPHHWRRGYRRQRMLNPDSVPLTIESFGQNLHDLHSVVLAARALGYEKIGIIGASLGGLTASLYATTNAPVDFMFMAVPAVKMEYLEPKGRHFGFKVDDQVLQKSRAALELVTPLSYEPGFDVERLCVVSNGGDRLCEPRFTHGWIKKWAIQNHVEVVGGHWLYFNRSLRGKTWYGWLGKMGYINR